jgi:hypothetical protein
MERNRIKRTVLIAAAGVVAYLIGFLSTIGSAQTPAPSPDRFDRKVREDFFAGFSGNNNERLARGMKACEDALAANPKNAEALVWHGSGVFYQSGQAFQGGDQAKGIEMWTRGLKEMQAAVELEPDNPGTRIPRGAALLTGTRFAPPEMASLSSKTD